MGFRRASHGTTLLYTLTCAFPTPHLFPSCCDLEAHLVVDLESYQLVVMYVEGYTPRTHYLHIITDP